MVRSSHSPAKTRTRQKETLCVRCTGWQRSRPWERNWQEPIRMVRTKAKTPARELPLAGKNEGHERPLVILGHQWETKTAEKPSISSELSKTRIVHAPFIANTSNLARPGVWRGLCLLSVVPRVWSLHRGTSIIWKLVRNAESQVPSQTFQTRICILTRSTGDLYAYCDTGSAAPGQTFHSAGNQVSDTFFQCHPG